MFRSYAILNVCLMYCHNIDIKQLCTGLQIDVQELCNSECVSHMYCHNIDIKQLCTGLQIDVQELCNSECVSYVLP